jgi:hypothetical protein
MAMELDVQHVSQCCNVCNRPRFTNPDNDLAD